MISLASTDVYALCMCAIFPAHTKLIKSLSIFVLLSEGVSVFDQKAAQLVIMSKVATIKEIFPYLRDIFSGVFPRVANTRN